MMEKNKVRSRRSLFATIGAVVAGAAIPNKTTSASTMLEWNARSRAQAYTAMPYDGTTTANEIRRIERLQLISIGPVRSCA